jgi:hypothetical protein
MTKQYIAHDDTHIHGLGQTPAEAEADALLNCRDLTGLKTAPCTEALALQVQNEGGAITWDEIDGTACTEAEHALDQAAPALFEVAKMVVDTSAASKKLTALQIQVALAMLEGAALDAIAKAEGKQT